METRDGMMPASPYYDLKKLVEKGLVRRAKRGRYLITPEGHDRWMLLFSGTWADRTELQIKAQTEVPLVKSHNLYGQTFAITMYLPGAYSVQAEENQVSRPIRSDLYTYLKGGDKLEELTSQVTKLIALLLYQRASFNLVKLSEDVLAVKADAARGLNLKEIRNLLLASPRARRVFHPT
jgi:hypothetical protein